MLLPHGLSILVLCVSTTEFLTRHPPGPPQPLLLPAPPLSLTSQASRLGIQTRGLPLTPCFLSPHRNLPQPLLPLGTVTNSLCIWGQ